MSSEAPSIEQLKRGMQATWMAGDFGQIAKYSEKGAEEFVGRLDIRPECKVLDVACGTGNLAIPAARLGAKVVGVDIAPNLLDQARRRASAEGLNATFEEGDAERLSAKNGEFDLVMTMFGAMFAPRPEQVASELIRVCRPGGTIAMANWISRWVCWQIVWDRRAFCSAARRHSIAPALGRRNGGEAAFSEWDFKTADHSAVHGHGLSVLF